MHSAEPNEPRFVNHSTPAAEEAWRAEVALRVDSYRARRKRKGGEEDSPALDFVPAAGVAASFVARPEKSETRTPSAAAHNPFDTNYYRRLNAESMAQAPGIMAATAAAMAPAPEPEAEFEAERNVKPADDVRDNDVRVDDARTNSVLDLELRPNVVAESYLDHDYISAPEPEPEHQPEPESAAAPATQGNLIVFRRPLLEPPLVPQPSRDELAEPMYNRPRILEVPEDIMPAVQGSLFPDIQLDADEQEASNNLEPEFEVPLPVALVSSRLMAGLADLGVVLAAGVLFAAMATFALPGIPHTKPFWMALGAVTLLLWAVYQHLFLLYAGRTPGMSMQRIRLSTFDGAVPQWSQRVSRARYMFVSLASVALGFLWAMADEDTLCWHDRLSKTFPTAD